jgi:hypothetical protein
MKANFGLLPELETPVRNKELRHEGLVARASAALDEVEGVDHRSHAGFIAGQLGHDTQVASHVNFH